MEFVIGVDEAGRGPLAGPLAVGAVMVRSEFDVRKAFPDARDSKVLSPAKREEIYREMQTRSLAGDVFFTVRFSQHLYIDTFGISKATEQAVSSCIRSLVRSPEVKPRGVKILLDGLLHAPEEYEQETIIRGDATEPLISLASIVAKVRRDRLMVRLAKKYPQYAFEVHKGYGTAAHRASIREHGLSAVHRRSFCRGLISG